MPSVNSLLNWLNVVVVRAIYVHDLNHYLQQASPPRFIVALLQKILHVIGSLDGDVFIRHLDRVPPAVRSHHDVRVINNPLRDLLSAQWFFVDEDLANAVGRLVLFELVVLLQHGVVRPLVDAVVRAVEPDEAQLSEVPIVLCLSG